MSAEKLLFNFSRKLPPPFDTLGSAKVKVASKYTTGATDATLTATVLKALLAYCGFQSDRDMRLYVRFWDDPRRGKRNGNQK